MTERRPLLVLLALCCLAALSVGCGPRDRSASSTERNAAQQEPAPPKPPGTPPPAPAPTPPPPAPPAGGTQDAPKKPQVDTSDLPVMTGDKTKDKKAILTALEKVDADWSANEKALTALTKEGQVTKPDPAKLAELKAKNETLKAKAGKLQEMLDKLGS